MSHDQRIVLRTLGVTALVIGVCYFALLGWLMHLGSNAKNYLDATVPVIVSKWEPGDFLKETDGRYRGADDQATLQKMYRVFRALGQLHSYGGSTGTVELTYHPPFGVLLHGTFVSQSQFDKGPATITVSIHKADGRWYIDNLQMKSKALFSDDA